MNTTAHLIPFAFGEHLIRTVDQDGTPWFVAADVCAVLEIEKHRDAVARLDDDERGSVVVDTLGGRQTVAAVNESGIYHLTFKSRKPAAKVFRKWVTSEVLPAIRKTGSYLSPEARGILERAAAVVELSPAAAEFLSLLHAQILVGVPPAMAARYAAKLSPAAAPEPRIPGAIPGSVLPHGSGMTAADELIASMEEGRRYNVDELLPMLPTHHPIHQRKAGKGRQSALGRLLNAYVQAGRLRRELGTDHRSAFIRLPSVVAFTTDS